MLRNELLQTIRTVYAGRTYLPAPLVGALEPQSDSPTLSQREIEILVLVARGLSNKQIAYTLDITETTAKNHVQHILQKLGAQDRTRAAAAGHSARHYPFVGSTKPSC